MTVNPGRVERLIEKNEGVLKLRPTYVRRLYMDGGRLFGRKPGATFIKRDQMWVPERWLASTTDALNPNPIPGEGLSRLSGSQLTLKDAIEAVPERLLGASRFNAHGPEFRVLVKLLDGAIPITFHFHASDQMLSKYPRNFKGHRFGKGEAYYFLDGPKGQCPYTHVGLQPGTTANDLKKALARGQEAALELSPFFLQRYEEGFYLPAGVVHRPGTAYTLEIQQPSDVYTLLDDRMGEVRFTPQGMHPGFRSLDEAMKCIDYKTSTQKDIVERFRIVPKSVSRKQPRGVREDWIFPPKMCPQFSGKRLRVKSSYTTTEKDCYAALIWKGAGTFGPHKIKAGDEFFVSAEAAKSGLRMTCDKGEYLEIFKLFAAPTK